MSSIKLQKTAQSNVFLFLQEKYISIQNKMQSVNKGEVTNQNSHQTIQQKMSSSTKILKYNLNEIEQISKDYQNQGQKTDIFAQYNPINSFQRIKLKQVQSKQTEDIDIQDYQVKNIIRQGFESCLNIQNPNTSNRLSSQVIFHPDYQPQPNFSAAPSTNPNNTIEKHENLFQAFKNDQKHQHRVRFNQSYAESMAFVNRVRQSKSRGKQNIQIKQVQQLKQISLKRKPSIKQKGRYSQNLINTQEETQKTQQSQSNSKTLLPSQNIFFNQNQRQNSSKQKISQNKNYQITNLQNTHNSQEQQHFLTKICKFDMKKLSDIEKATLVVELFNTYDKNQDEVLDRQQVSQMLKAYSQDKDYIPSQKQITKFFKSFNCRSTHRITSDQMYQYMQSIRDQDSEEQMQMMMEKNRRRCNRSGPSAPIVKVSGSGNMQVSVTINQYQRIEENVRIDPHQYKEMIREQEQNRRIKQLKYQLDKERRLRLKQQQYKNKLEKQQLKQLQIQGDDQQTSIKSLKQTHKNQSNSQKGQKIFGQKYTVTTVQNSGQSNARGKGGLTYVREVQTFQCFD